MSLSVPTLPTVRPGPVPAVLRRIGRFRIGHLVALGWAEMSLRRVRVQLAAVGTGARVAPPVRDVPAGALRLVRRYLVRRGANCIEKSLITQSWLNAQGRPMTVVVGVGKKEGGFMAHAWIPGYDHPAEGKNYKEIARLEP